MNKGLIVKPFWGELILSGEKTYECRRMNCNYRGKIYIIYSGTGMVYGECEVVDSFLVTEQNFYDLILNHRIMVPFEELPPNYKYFWKLENAVLYDEPIPYKHPRGAQIWVDLGEDFSSNK